MVISVLIVVTTRISLISFNKLCFSSFHVVNFNSFTFKFFGHLSINVFYKMFSFEYFLVVNSVQMLHTICFFDWLAMIGFGLPPMLVWLVFIGLVFIKYWSN